jgi:hypothetical protein
LPGEKTAGGIMISICCDKCGATGPWVEWKPSKGMLNRVDEDVRISGQMRLDRSIAFDLAELSGWNSRHYLDGAWYIRNRVLQTTEVPRFRGDGSMHPEYPSFVQFINDLEDDHL